MKIHWASVSHFYYTEKVIRLMYGCDGCCVKSEWGPMSCAVRIVYHMLPSFPGSGAEVMFCVRVTKFQNK